MAKDFKREKRLLVKAMESYSVVQYKAITEKLVSQHGAKQFTEWWIEVLATVPADIAEWAYKLQWGEDSYRRVIDKAKELLHESLSEDGFQLGRDFSFGANGELIMNKAAAEAI